MEKEVYVVLDWDACLEGKDYRMVLGVYENEPVIDEEDEESLLVVSAKLKKDW